MSGQIAIEDIVVVDDINEENDNQKTFRNIDSHASSLHINVSRGSVMIATTGSSLGSIMNTVYDIGDETTHPGGWIKKILVFFRRMLISVSFIVLVLCMASSIIPMVMIWRHAVVDIISTMQAEKMQILGESILSVTSQKLLTKVESCETTLVGYTSFFNTLPQSKVSDVREILTVQQGMLAKTMMATCGIAVALSGNDGIVLLFEKDAIVQYGTEDDPECIIYGYLTQADNPFAIGMGMPIDVECFSMVSNNVGLSNKTAMLLINGSRLAWNDFIPRVLGEFVGTTIEIASAWTLGTGDEKTVRGFVEISVGDMIFSNLFTDEIDCEDDGLMCVIVVDSHDRIVASNCENVTYLSETDGTPQLRYVWESTVSFVAAAYEILSSGNEQRIVSVDGYEYAMMMVESAYGFSVRIVAISDTRFLETKYRSIMGTAKTYVIAGVISATITALIAGLITFSGQVKVIQRINTIINKNAKHIGGHHRLTNVVTPEEEVNGTEKRTTAVIRKLLWSKLDVVSRLSEVSFVLQKLDWLDGKVQIVRTFVPNVARLVCTGNDRKDQELLQSTIERRNGCYMFCDIEGFTPLCESVSPTLSGTILEHFYAMVEKCANVIEDDVLIKRLGDGVFLTWGYRFQTEKQCDAAAKHSVLAYAAAIRIGESVGELDREITRMIAQETTQYHWKLTLRIGITTGSALHGIMKTAALYNPDVIGRLINLASRLQYVGKCDMVKEIGKSHLVNVNQSGKAVIRSNEEARIACTIVTDTKTMSVVKIVSGKMEKPTRLKISLLLQNIAIASIDSHHIYEDICVSVQGIDIPVTVSVTFVATNETNAFLEFDPSL